MIHRNFQNGVRVCRTLVMIFAAIEYFCIVEKPEGCVEIGEFWDLSRHTARGHCSRTPLVIAGLSLQVADRYSNR